MTRTKAEPSAPAPANPLKPTKLTSRRGVETQALKSVDISRDANQPDILFRYVNISVDGSGDNVGLGDRSNRLDKSKGAIKIGLGPTVTNLKPQHAKPAADNLKVADLLKRYKFAKTTDNQSQDEICNGVSQLSILKDEDICNGIKKMSIYKENDEEAPKSEKEAKQKNLLRESYKGHIALKNTLETGQPVTVLVAPNKYKTFKNSSSAVRKAGVRNWKGPDATEDASKGLVKNLLSWSLPTSTRWKDTEARIAVWNNFSKQESKCSGEKLEDIAEMLGISVDHAEKLMFHKDLDKVLDVLRGHICHSSLPWLTTLSSLINLQNGNMVGATRDAVDGLGTFLHSEIIDRHVCYMSRSEDLSQLQPNARSSFSTKTELFRKQIQDTISFARKDTEFDDTSSFLKSISSFNPDWNIIQISGLMQCKNRHGRDIIGQRQIPQLLISAMSHIPKEAERSTFTTYCRDPPVYEGSLMRLGLMEEFQKILDKNLVISDDAVVISRRNYWEERKKHNEAMLSVIKAMEEDWIGPWNFLLPGHIACKPTQDTIMNKIVTPAAKKYKLSSSRKLLLYKLTENYDLLHLNTKAGLDTMVSFILNVSETSSGVSTLCKKIVEIGSAVPFEQRHPTVLIIDQDLEIYPWESMECLVYTDVTRMPSVNLIRSNYNFVTSLRPSYPDIVDENSCTFVLNPDGSLPNVQKRLESYFTEHKNWYSVIGRPPQTKEIQDCLENQHVFLYNGHGAGSNFYPDYAIQKLVCQAVPLLMGCASAQSHYSVPRMYGNATIHSYFIAGCPSVVGYLWEVTDAECDRITVDLIERWLPDENIKPPKIQFLHELPREKAKCLSTAMRLSRKAATQYLTQCAIVCYGLPINTLKSKR